jgi:hypothetical protein
MRIARGKILKVGRANDICAASIPERWLLCPTGRVRGSQPARRSGRGVKKRMNSNIDVM